MCMKQIMVICDYEAGYVFRLSEYITSNELLPFEAVGFHDEKKCREFIAQNKVTILLICEELLRSIIDSITMEEVVILSDGSEKSILINEKKYPCISKFQSALSIAKQILEACTTSSQIFYLPTDSKKQMIGIYSPVRRSLQTSFSLVLGQSIAKRRKCLYINLEPYSGFHYLFQKNYEQNIVDLLYFLEKGRDKFPLKLQTIVETIGNLDYIPPAISFMDLMELSPKDWQMFIGALHEQTNYECIIMDLSDYIQGLFEILSACDLVYTVTKNDGVAIAKMSQYEKILSYTNHGEILDKTRKIQFPVFKELPGQIDKLMYSELANYVKKLMKEDQL